MFPGSKRISSRCHRPEIRTTTWHWRLVRQWVTTTLLPLALAAVLWALGTSAYADRVILRDLSILNNVTVRGFDEDGVQVTDRGLLRWDEIEQATVAEARQEEFDRLLKELGGPLFRIRQRLAVGDFAGAGEPAETIYERYRDRNSPSAYMVTQAAMWGRLAGGRRESALEAYLACYRHLRSNPEIADQLPGDRRLRFDEETGLTPELQPIFFDQEAAQKALPQTRRIAQSIGAPVASGVLVYFISLAQTAEDWEAAARVAESLPGGNGPWAHLLEAQRQIAQGEADAVIQRLSGKEDSWTAALRPAAYYYLGKARAASDTPDVVREGVVDLLHVPALASDRREDRQLAGAALDEARKAFQRLRETDHEAAVRRELLLEFGETYHAVLLQTEP